MDIKSAIEVACKLTTFIPLVLKSLDINRKKCVMGVIYGPLVDHLKQCVFPFTAS